MSNQYGRDQRDYIRFRESDSSDDWTKKARPSRPMGRFEGRNRYGEEKIRHDHFQDDQFRNDYDPTYEDEYGMKHPYEHGGEGNRWSDDIRSEASRENHAGKGPRGYMRSEQRIKEEASEILTHDYDLDATDIELEVRDRCLVLKGEAHSRRDKRLAEYLVEDISGIEDVDNQLRIKKKVQGWIPGIKEIGKSGGQDGQAK